MPTFRSDLRTLRPYVAGKPIEEITREFGIDGIIKLASNEYPVSPVPAAIEAIAAAAVEVNRYPDNSYHDLTSAIAEMYETTSEHVWVGAGSSDILNCTARATGGTDTSVVYATP
ncbi:Aspartate aminotransferase, partial [hydrothermal vent metagenome]